MTTSPFRRFRSPAWLLAGVLALAACDDPFADFLRDVPEIPSEATLFDFASGRLQDPSAFDAVNARVVRVDQTTQWDILFRIQDGAPQLLPFSALADSVSEAGLLRSEQTFEGLLEAPEDGYVSDAPFDVQPGDVFIVRSRRDRTQILICSQFAKLEVIDLDAAAGTILFRYLRNPNCGDTVLEPGTHGSL